MLIGHLTRNVLRGNPANRVPLFGLNCCYSSKVGQQQPDSVPILRPADDRLSSSSALKIKTISQAMKAYLERAKKHEEFLKVKNEEFELGKLHLANMMGLDAATLTQDDIDKAIAYLLPSGLYEKKARPLMKPPSELFPREKAAQFDAGGRPYSPFFYTKHPNYHRTLHEAAGHFVDLDAFQDRMIEKGILEPPQESRPNLETGEWIKIEEVQGLFLEKITEEQYETLLSILARLAAHPYGFRVRDFIWRFRRDYVELGMQLEIPPLCVDEGGRPYVTATGHKKHCEARVTVRGNGTGLVSINGTDVFHFERLHDREQIMYPLHFCDLIGKVDVECDVTGPGERSQAGAVRHGLALCLRSFVPPEFVEKMRLAGMLTKDGRRRYRKMPGQKGNRAKFTWKKR